MSRALVRIDGDTRSGADIGRVFIRPPNKGVTIYLPSVAALPAFGGLGSPDARGFGLVCPLAALVLVVNAVVRPSNLFLRTASGDHPVLDGNGKTLRQVRNATEEALIRRA
ncbi:hypothetical protein [Rhizosaccharibacter radicis]|uniref:Uncharacterized protein n=1 Tax=Rhizosaccharibacter radicis TaxID=2782605 RepID=A0ABT1VUT3_9PROT|nr:hypothetical protein [Acetobacteraceae bacterium KSS12]